MGVKISNYSHAFFSFQFYLLLHCVFSHLLSGTYLFRIVASTRKQISIIQEHSLTAFLILVSTFSHINVAISAFFFFQLM